MRFAYVTKTLINEFWQDVASGIKTEAAKYKIKVDIQAAKDESSLVEQLNLAQTILSQKPDALLLSPQSDSNLVPVVEAAKSQYPDRRHRRCADRGRQHLRRHRPGRHRGQGGRLPAPALPQRRQGRADRGSGRLAQRAQAHPGLHGDASRNTTICKLVASQPGDWDRLTAMNATTNILRQHPDLVGVYANNDGMALGVVEAVAMPASSSRSRSSAPTASARRRSPIAEGEMKATVAEFPYEEGILGVQMALRLLGCQPIPPWVVSPQAVDHRRQRQGLPRSAADSKT